MSWPLPTKARVQTLFLHASTLGADSIIPSQQGDHEIMDRFHRGKTVYSAYIVIMFLKPHNKDIILHSPFFS
jgi:hypothetical protein